jgi:lipoprotein-anchoring transpeptidase ErfK/SrfK
MINLTSFIPYLLSLAGMAVLASGSPEAPARPLQPVASSQISGVAAIPAGQTRSVTPAGATPQAAAATTDIRPIDVRNIPITRELAVERWLEPGEFAWDEDAAATAQGRPIVVVNLRSRTLSVYKGGVELGRSSILYGFGDHPTPTGTFPILEKKRDHRSRTYNNAPMPHMLRLTRDGVAVHGSEELADDVGTHGCVGLPKEFAALLFEVMNVGDPVVVWSGRAA